MEQNQFAQLNEESILGLGRQIASMSVQNALALLDGVGLALIQPELLNNGGIKHCHPHGISMAAIVRLLESINLLRSIAAGRVTIGGDHKLTPEEQMLNARG